MVKLTHLISALEIIEPVLLKKCEHDGMSMKARLIPLIDKLEYQGASANDTTRYALVAWIDDILMNSDWPGQRDWLDLSFQQLYFKQNYAGDEFFSRLEKLRQYGHRTIDAVLIYYLCLEFGFVGYYRLSDPEECFKITKECADYIKPYIPSGAPPWKSSHPDRSSKIKSHTLLLKIVIITSLFTSMLIMISLWIWKQVWLHQALTFLSDGSLS